MKPLTEWACQPVAFINSLSVAPFGRFSKSTTLAVLLPSRAEVAFFRPLGAFFAGLAFLADLAFFVAAWGFLFGFGGAPVAGAVPVSSVVDAIICILLLAVITVTTWITPVRLESKSILRQRRKGDALAMMTGTETFS